VIQPILARRTEKGYEIIAGERRWRAAKQLGLTEIPVIVKRDVSDVSSLEIALIENIQREELNPINEAEAYKKLINNFGYSLEQVGQVVGKNKTTVSNSVRLLALDKEIRDKLVSGELSTGHAKVLLSVTNEYRQKKLAEIVLKHQLSVRQLELLVEKTPGKRTKKGAAKDPEVARIEEDLQHYLGTKVSLITGRKRGGRLEIHFFSPEDLDRLLKLVMK
jgi:ParB family chromosome partitioning protein